MNEKLYRNFKNDWFEPKSGPMMYDAMADFCTLSENIYTGLKNIEKYDKQFFNEHSDVKIEEYIQLFNKFYDDILNRYFIKRNVPFESDLTKFKYNPKYLPENCADEFVKNYVSVFPNPKKFSYAEYFYTPWNKDIKVCAGVKPVYFNDLKRRINKIFLLEHEVKCLVMKNEFWEDRMTNLKNKPELPQDFIICGKKVFKYGWRSKKCLNDENFDDYISNRVYTSASLIDSNNSEHLIFNNFNRGAVSFLILYLLIKPDAQKIVCACKDDGFSDEYIDGKNPFTEATAHTSVEKCDESQTGDSLHELFASSTTFATPYSMLTDDFAYNELVFKNPEVVAVASPENNSESIKYSMELAKKYGVQYVGVLPKEFVHISLR